MKNYYGKNPNDEGSLRFQLSLQKEENVALSRLPKQENQSHSVPVETKVKKKYVGVRQRPSGRWVAEIKDTTQKIRLWLGTFNTAEDAARAYDEAACLLRGTNTRTNFTHSNADESALPTKAAKTLLCHRGTSKPNPTANNVSAAQKLLDFSRPKRSTCNTDGNRSPKKKKSNILASESIQAGSWNDLTSDSTSGDNYDLLTPTLLQEPYGLNEVTSILNNPVEPSFVPIGTEMHELQNTGKRSRDMYEDTQTSVDMSTFDIYSGFHQQMFEDIPRNRAEPVHTMNDCFVLAGRAMSSPSLSLPPDT